MSYSKNLSNKANHKNEFLLLKISDVSPLNTLDNFSNVK